jgi:hypothetical protein
MAEAHIVVVFIFFISLRKKKVKLSFSGNFQHKMYNLLRNVLQTSHKVRRLFPQQTIKVSEICISWGSMSFWFKKKKYLKVFWELNKCWHILLCFLRLVLQSCVEFSLVSCYLFGNCLYRIWGFSLYKYKWKTLVSGYK